LHQETKYSKDHS